MPTHTTLCSGDIFGEMATIDCGLNRMGLAVDDCKLLKIPGIFINLAERNHKFSLGYCESSRQICRKLTREFLISSPRC